MEYAVLTQFFLSVRNEFQPILLYISKPAVMLPIKFILFCCFVFVMFVYLFLFLRSCQTCVRADRRGIGFVSINSSLLCPPHPCMSFEALKLSCMHEIVKLSFDVSSHSHNFFRISGTIHPHSAPMKTGLSFIVKWRESDVCCNSLPKPMFLCSIFIVLFKKIINVN